MAIIDENAREPVRFSTQPSLNRVRKIPGHPGTTPGGSESFRQPVIPPAPLTGDVGRGCGDASRALLFFQRYQDLTSGRRFTPDLASAIQPRFSRPRRTVPGALFSLGLKITQRTSGRHRQAFAFRDRVPAPATASPRHARAKQSFSRRPHNFSAMPGTHILCCKSARKTWMAGTSPAMTKTKSVFRRAKRKARPKKNPARHEARRIHSREYFSRSRHPYATLGARLRELRWKNSAWLATAETIAGWNGFEIRNAGSGRSPVRKRSG